MRLMRCGALLVGLAMVVACGGAGVEEGEPLGTSTSALGGWTVKQLAGGFSPSLVMDATGNPVVGMGQGVPDPESSRYDVTPVLFTNDGRWRSGAGWSSTAIGHVPGFREGNSHLSAAIVQGSPQLVYSSQSNAGGRNPIHLKMAKKRWGAWETSTVADDGWFWQAVLRSDGDSSWIVYPDPDGNDELLRIATTASGAWKTHLLPLPHSLTNSIDAAVGTVDGKTVLGVATTTLGRDPQEQGLFFAASYDGGVTFEPAVNVDNTWAMIGPQLAYSGGNPMIAYTELDSHQAKFAYSDDGGKSWTVETIGTFDTNPATGLAVDPRTGEPVVVLETTDLAAAEDRIQVARRDPKGHWSLEIVDRMPFSSGLSFMVNPRIAVAADGVVVLAYSVFRSYTEEYVRLAWDVPLIITPGAAE